jgi:hypothetical protein
MNLLRFFILYAVFGLASHADDYRFGEGFSIADSSLVVGGYFSSEYLIQNGSRTFDVDDVAVMAYGEIDRFAYLIELEASDFYLKETGNRTDEQSNRSFHIERMYGDYFFDGDERLRIGKFNSDIGFWNQMPINVLRDTTSSPVLEKEYFPNLTTGIHYESRRIDGDVKRVSITVQNNRDLDSDYNNFDIDRHYAAALDVGDDDALWRFSGGYFRYVTGREAVFATASFRMNIDDVTLLAETLVRHDEPVGTTYDGYIQGVWHAWPKHDFILRTEHGKSPVAHVTDSSVTVGYTYRPLNNIALKGEYEAHEEDGLNHWLFSLSAMF